jgi:uncharacterized protein (TIGR02594 family)
VSGPRWLEIAREELEAGVAEIAGPEANPSILAYHQATSLKATSDEVPWCSAFTSWCLERSFVTSTHSASARSYCQWGVSVSVVHPPEGAIVVLRRGEAWQGHVGFYLPGASQPNHILLLGGNQGDRVSVAEFPVDRVLSMRWPAGGDNR